MKIIKRWELYFGDENVGKTLIFINGDKLKIDEIDIYKSVQGKGYATMYMDQIAKAADKNNVTLVLTPSNYKGSSKKRLDEFYKRFGFVMNKGRAKDYSISELMYRKPQ